MKICSRCVLPETFPGIEFDQQGICNFCNGFEGVTPTPPEAIFKSEQELIQCLQKYRNPGNDYDVLVPLSGGVDSCNALITIVEKFKLRPLGFHNDHGYEDEIATMNVRTLCEILDVDLVIMKQDIKFMKKLWKYINEAPENINSCYICGNILYLNALEIADRFNISLVINGYSKGQAAMTNDKNLGGHLLEKVIELIGKTNDKKFFNWFTRKYKILPQKKDYRVKKDLEEMDPDKILVVPYYLFDFYCNDKEKLKTEIKKRFNWKPMKTSYPRRTTNCEMVWLNTYMDRVKMGYSLYELEYSELIRKGDFTREQAIKDLEFDPPEGIIQRLANEVNVDINNFEKKNHVKTNENKKLTIEFDF